MQTVVHVERTDDPAVLRWVCTSPSLADVPNGPRSLPWQQLPGLSQVAEMVVADDGILVRLRDAGDWPRVVHCVHDSVVAALQQRADWLFDPIEPVAPWASVVSLPVVTIEEVQRLVDVAAGAITGAHGGGIAVTGIDGETVRLRLSGACHGCRFTDDTVTRVVEPAVRRVFPKLGVVVDR